MRSEKREVRNEVNFQEEMLQQETPSVLHPHAHVVAVVLEVLEDAIKPLIIADLHPSFHAPEVLP